MRGEVAGGVRWEERAEVVVVHEGGVAAGVAQGWLPGRGEGNETQRLRGCWKLDAAEETG